MSTKAATMYCFNFWKTSKNAFQEFTMRHLILCFILSSIASMLT